jgi:hypothetical protein
MSNKNGAIKLRARILAIENIHTRDNVVAFNKIACNKEEKLPRVLRVLSVQRHKF